jgi:hypothetical protein
LYIVAIVIRSLIISHQMAWRFTALSRTAYCKNHTTVENFATILINSETSDYSQRT